MGRAQGATEHGNTTTARRGERSAVAAESAESAFADVLGARRGGGRKAVQEDPSEGVRALVLDGLRRAASEELDAERLVWIGAELDVVVEAADRWVAVAILDDDTQPHRQALSFPSRDAAVDWLADCDENYVGEYLIDLDGADREHCCWQFDADGGQVGALTPFHESNISFA